MVSRLSPSGPNCPGLLGRFLGAAPGVVSSCIPEHLPMRGGWWEGAGMQEEGSLPGNGNGAEPWQRPPFQTGIWENRRVSVPRLPCSDPTSPPAVDVTQGWPASPLPRMLLQEEGAGARRGALSVRDHPCRQFDWQPGVVALNPALQKPSVPARD